MASADLRKLIERATPHAEDVRVPDRTDIVRKEHGHFTLREAVDALDALEFVFDSFVARMRELGGAKPPRDPAAPEATALHGLFRAAGSLRVLSPAVPTASWPQREGPKPPEPAAEMTTGWEEVVAAARAEGAECFKRKDFALAISKYGAAIGATPQGHADLHTFYSNRSAAFLQTGDAESALADAQCCVELAPNWPKGYFREGSCLRQLARQSEAAQAFRRGQALEPDNKDWARELEKTERQLAAQPEALVQQLVLNLMPEILAAWVRGGDSEGVLQLQVAGEFKEFGAPKWHLVKERNGAAKAQMRYAFLRRKDYLANLAANLQSPCEGVAVADLAGKPLKIADVGAFLSGGGSGEVAATIHIDVRNGGSDAKHMAAIICRIPCDSEVQRFLAPRKDPAPPKGAVDGVLQLQQKNGFPKVLPRLLGFQSFPGDLNFPVIDLERDAPASS